MSKNLVVVAPVRSSLRSKYNRVVVGAFAVAPVFAMAEGGTALDMSTATSTLVLALAAVGALGAAKVAPAALTWVWSLVTGMAKRG